RCGCRSCFFFTDTSTPESYTLSLHDALPIFKSLVVRPDTPEPDLEAVLHDGTGDILIRWVGREWIRGVVPQSRLVVDGVIEEHEDRKSTRLNSSHLVISYAAFCLKKKNH